MPSASGSYGRLADKMWVKVEIFKIPYRLNYLDFYYGTAHIQVYKLTRVTRCASRNFACNSHVGLV